MSENNEDCTEIDEGILNSFIRDDSKTYYKMDSAYYDGKSGELLYSVYFLSSLSSSLPHTLNLKI